MVNDDGALRIVRSWADPDSLTGESSCYETEDGRCWRSVYNPDQGTGTSCATKIGNLVIPGTVSFNP